MSKYAVVNILRFENGELEYSDDDSSWKTVTPDEVTMSPKPGELVLWFAGKNVDKITDIRLDSGTDIFARAPQSKFGGRLWFGKVKDNAPVGAQAKYDIFYESDGTPGEVDPLIEVKPGP